MYKLANIYQIFKLNRDVRQGEHLSPFSFSLFINDLEDYLLRKPDRGFTCLYLQIQDDSFVMLKLCLLFYADKTVP